jgi:hypothetical protein
MKLMHKFKLEFPHHGKCLVRPSHDILLRLMASFLYVSSSGLNYLK